MSRLGPRCKLRTVPESTNFVGDLFIVHLVRLYSEIDGIPHYKVTKREIWILLLLVFHLPWPRQTLLSCWQCVDLDQAPDSITWWRCDLRQVTYYFVTMWPWTTHLILLGHVGWDACPWFFCGVLPWYIYFIISFITFLTLDKAHDSSLVTWCLG